jgi:cathepsin D
VVIYLVAWGATDPLSSSEFSADGVLGMGFQSISKLNEPTFFQNVVKDHIVYYGSFAFRLVEPFSLTIGGLDFSLYEYTEEPTYTPVTHEGYWQIEFSSLKIGDASVVEFPTPAIVDSVRLEPIWLFCILITSE